MRHFERFVFIEPVFGNEFSQKCAIHAARNIVAGGDGQEGARVVIEADGVIEAGGLCSLLAKSHHALGAVMEPPWRSEAETRIVTGQRC